MTNGDSFQVPPELPQNARIGLAVASLVLGIVAVVLSFLGVGVILGVLGIVFGAAHLSSGRSPRAMAKWGLGLSIAGLLASLGFIAFYAYFVYWFIPMMDFEDIEEQSPFVEWEGVRAPDFNVTTLDGSTLTLSELQGKRVMVAVWATWSPPSVEQVPEFVKLTNEVSSDDLIIIAVSDEPEETIRGFAGEEGINYAVASFDDLPEPYGDVIDVPTTFMIDRNGVVQQVLDGYQEFEDLHAAATAPDFAGTPTEEPLEPVDDLIAPAQALEARERWQVDVPGAMGMCSGDWNGDGATDLLVSTDEPGLRVLGQDGDEFESITLPAAYDLLEVGNYHGQLRLLGYTNWGEVIDVFDKSGEKAWDYSAWMGVNGAHWIDTDGDGTDEMVAGMNGAGGLHLVSAEGKRLWKANLGNVWNQTAVRSSDGKTLIVATEADGSVRLFDADGERLRGVKPLGDYYTNVTSAAFDGGDTIQILAGGSERTVALDGRGRLLWSTPAEEDHDAWRAVNFASGDVNGDSRPDWAFFGLDGALLIVSAAGEKLAELPDQVELASFTFLGNHLVTLDGERVTGYTFDPIADTVAAPEALEATPESAVNGVTPAQEDGQ